MFGEDGIKVNEIRKAIVKIGQIKFDLFLEQFLAVALEGVARACEITGRSASAATFGRAERRGPA